MKIKELADLVGTTPRTIRHYHHEGLLPNPDNPGVRDHTLDHAVRLVRIRHLTESGLNLATIRGMMEDPDLSLDAELELAEAAIDAQIGELERQKQRLRALMERRGRADPTDPLPYAEPENLAAFYEQVSTRLPPHARPYFDMERRAVEVALRIPFARRLLDDWLSRVTPERLDGTVEVYHLFARLPEMSAEEAQSACAEELDRFRATFGPDWGIGVSHWRNMVRPVLMAPGVLTLFWGIYRHPNQQYFIRAFLEEVAQLMEEGVSRETSGH